MSPVLAKLTLLQCVGYFSIVAWRFEIQLDLDELWLPINHLSFLESAQACEVCPSLHQRALVWHWQQLPESACCVSGLSNLTDRLYLTTLGPGKHDAAGWVCGKGCSPWWVPAGLCLTFGAVSHPAPGPGFPAGRGQPRRTPQEERLIRFCTSLGATRLSVHAELRLSAGASK